MHRIRRALLSVSDKTGLVPFARALHENEVELISTGGTATALREEGLPVTDVSDVTRFPEIMDGRVKTLHPLIHGGLLGRLDHDDDRQAMQDHGIESIDLLVVNLYPFEQTVAREDSTPDQIIEQIDIGGPAMIRAAAKNGRHTAVVVSPDQYAAILEELRTSDMEISESTRLQLSRRAFERTAAYDRAIADWFSREGDRTEGDPSTTLRYGENPHQTASLSGSFFSLFEQTHGKELSYNNILDVDAATRLVTEFDEPTVVIVKHNNPCGVGSAEKLSAAWEKAFATDRQSPFGGIVAVNRPFDRELADIVNEIFTEVLIAPAYEPEALELLEKKKNRRILRYDPDGVRQRLSEDVSRSVLGGLLRQSADNLLFDGKPKVVTRREPDVHEMKALHFAWKVAKHVRSNAIVYAAADRTLGIGAGQMSRVDSAMIARIKAEKAGLDLRGSAVASDAFFPFADGLMEAVEAGATSVIQPGGSIRDEEVIEAADAHDIAMVLTGMRHFRH